MHFCVNLYRIFWLI